LEKVLNPFNFEYLLTTPEPENISKKVIVLFCKYLSLLIIFSTVLSIKGINFRLFPKYEIICSFKKGCYTIYY